MHRVFAVVAITYIATIFQMIVPIKYQRVCRWAVKEATYKALNERVGETIRFYEICYLREESSRFFDLLAAMHSFCIQEIE